MLQRKNCKRVLVRGYDNLNLGDDLFFRILVDRYPYVDFYLQSTTNYESIINRPNFHRIRYNIINRVLNKIKSHVIPYQILLQKFDAVVTIGGSILMEIDSTGTCGTIENLTAIKQYLKNTPLHIIGCNYGPENTHIFRSKVRSFFNTIDSVCFRDSHSYNIFKDNKNVSYASDIVFLLPLAEKNDSIYNRIGISVINLSSRKTLKSFEKPYIRYIEQIIKDAIKRGQKISLFSFCDSEGDMIACLKIKMLFSVEEQKFIDIIAYCGNIDEYLESLKQIDLLYATRYHATILGLLYKIPTIPLIYSDKVTHVLEDIGYTGQFVDLRKNLENSLLDIKAIPVLNDFDLNRLIRSAEKQFTNIDLLFIK